jgi:hypothetical protein
MRPLRSLENIRDAGLGGKELLNDGVFMDYRSGSLSFFRCMNPFTHRVVNTCRLALALFVSVTPSHAATYPTNATTSKYYNFYSKYVHSGAFWKSVTKMGSVTISNGLAIRNTSGTYGPVSSVRRWGML